MFYETDKNIRFQMIEVIRISHKPQKNNNKYFFDIMFGIDWIN